MTSWPDVPLKEILDPRDERPSPEEIETEEIPIVSKISFVDGRAQFRPGFETKTGMIRVCPGDLLVSGINAYKGAIAVYDGQTPAAATIHYSTYKIREDRADIRFLWYLLRSDVFRDRLSQSVPGGIKTELKPARLLPVTVPLPPLPEQRRIVEKIKKLAIRIEEALSIRQRTAAQAKVLVDAKSAAIFRNARENGSEPLESVATLERGKFSHRPRNEPMFFGGAHPWIQIAEIESARKFIRQWTQTLNDDGLAISKKFPRGTVLISIAATIGSVGILDFDCCVPDSIVGVTPHPGTESEFLYHYLGYLRGHLEEIAPRSAQKNINLQILARLPVPKLSPAKQRRIVVELDMLQAKVDALQHVQTETADELDALLPAILDRAFKGGL